MLERVDLRELIGAHLRTLRSYRTKRYRLPELALFFGVPTVAAGFFVFGDLTLASVDDVLVTAVSLFSGLLFSLLMLIYDAARKNDAGDQRGRLRGDLLSHAFANTAFAIVMAIPTILITLLPRLFPTTELLVKVSNGIAVFLFLIFILTLLMIIKRVGALMRSDIAGMPRSTLPERDHEQRAAG